MTGALPQHLFGQEGCATQDGRFAKTAPQNLLRTHFVQLNAMQNGNSGGKNNFDLERLTTESIQDEQRKTDHVIEMAPGLHLQTEPRNAAPISVLRGDNDQGENAAENDQRPSSSHRVKEELRRIPEQRRKSESRDEDVASDSSEQVSRKYICSQFISCFSLPFCVDVS